MLDHGVGIVTGFWLLAVAVGVVWKAKAGAGAVDLFCWLLAQGVGI